MMRAALLIVLLTTSAAAEPYTDMRHRCYGPPVITLPPLPVADPNAVPVPPAEEVPPVTPACKRFVTLTVRTSYDGAIITGLSFRATAFDTGSTVRNILIATGSKQIVQCASNTCGGTWLRSSTAIPMAATNDILITATNASGVKFTLPTRVSRP